LILLRGEANIGSGNGAAAIASINVIRTGDDGLGPIGRSFSGGMLDNMLHVKRCSLLGDGGRR
jgi:hypothetical protein